MKFLLVSVVDRVAGLYMSPQVAPNIGAAVRSFGDAVQNEQSPFHKHPSHYQLIGVGLWDDVAGLVGPWDDTNSVLSNGSDWATESMAAQIKKL